uniref:Testin n=1 Tax=Lates calcarifer TaxID=8187 RepID=A0A4W6C3V9_LATCA
MSDVQPGVLCCNLSIFHYHQNEREECENESVSVQFVWNHPFNFTLQQYPTGTFCSCCNKTRACFSVLLLCRKICRNCKCGLAEHDVAMNSEENKKVGKLFEDTKYTGLIAKLKTDGLPSYRGNMITISLPTSSTAYIVPPSAVRYIELLPPEKRPVAGTEGAAYRRQQMARQLPEHDQDPSKCHELSPAEVKQMEQFVRKYKDEALGVGDVLLPEEMALVQAGGQGGAGGVGAGRSMGIPGSCHHCQQPMRLGEPAVYAERAGYDKLWHPACFVCCTCNELLVDMIYFWKKGKLYCGRHYGDSEKPRCGGCDELIFSNEYTQAEGQNWHLKHFCCFDCDCILAGETYVMENEKPVCKPCYMKNYAVVRLTFFLWLSVCLDS